MSSPLVVVVVLTALPLDVQGMMKALSDLVGLIAKFFLVHPLHVAIFGSGFPLLEGSRSAWVEGGHFHDFPGKSRFEPILEYLCGS